jgi:dihydrofolate reductase
MNISANMKPEVVLVVAVAANGVIGMTGGLPWHLPQDLSRVKAITMGKPLIMGRKTYESIGRPLPGRKTIVITRAKISFPSEVKVVKSFGCAVTYAEAYANDMGVDEIVAFGGARIYESAIPIAKKIYKTEVNLHPDGDTFFPEYKRDEWREVARTDFAPQNNSFAYSYVQLERI